MSTEKEKLPFGTRVRDWWSVEQNRRDVLGYTMGVLLLAGSLEVINLMMHASALSEQAEAIARTATQTANAAMAKCIEHLPDIRQIAHLPREMVKLLLDGPDPTTIADNFEVILRGGSQVDVFSDHTLATTGEIFKNQEVGGLFRQSMLPSQGEIFTGILDACTVAGP